MWPSVQNWTEIATLLGRDRSVASGDAVFLLPGCLSYSRWRLSDLRKSFSLMNSWCHRLWDFVVSSPRERFNVHCIFIRNLSVLIFRSNTEIQPAAFKMLGWGKVEEHKAPAKCHVRIFAFLNVSKEERLSFSYAKEQIYSIDPSSHTFQEIKDLSSKR